MTRLRTGAMPMAGVDHVPAPDPYEAGDRAREKAAAYHAWLNAGKPREQIEAEQRQRHQRRAEARQRHTGDR